MLFLCLNSVSLYDIVVIVSLLIGGLHLGQLVLHTVELDTLFFPLLLDLLALLILLSQLHINLLVLLCKLVQQGLLHWSHKWLES